jgi:hypothetical protein
MPFRLYLLALVLGASRFWCSLKERIKRSGWLLFVLGLLWSIPEWKHNFEFSLTMLSDMGGFLAPVAAVLLWPYFGYVLMTAGLGYVLFVGEPKQGIVHQPWWPIVGWSIFGLCLTAIIITTGWGAIQAHITEQVVTRTFWHLTDLQTQKLGKALDEVPVDQRFSIYIRLVLGNAQAVTMGNDLADIFHARGWTISGGQDSSLRADLLGINFVVGNDQGRRDKDAPPHAVELFYILKTAGINSTAAWEPRFDNNSLQLAIGSRPPDW